MRKRGTVLHFCKSRVSDPFLVLICCAIIRQVSSRKKTSKKKKSPPDIHERIKVKKAGTP